MNEDRCSSVFNFLVLMQSGPLHRQYAPVRFFALHLVQSAVVGHDKVERLQAAFVSTDISDDGRARECPHEGLQRQHARPQ